MRICLPGIKMNFLQQLIFLNLNFNKNLLLTLEWTLLNIKPWLAKKIEPILSFHYINTVLFNICSLCYSTVIQKSIPEFPSPLNTPNTLLFRSTWLLHPFPVCRCCCSPSSASSWVLRTALALLKIAPWRASATAMRLLLFLAILFRLVPAFWCRPCVVPTL